MSYHFRRGAGWCRPGGTKGLRGHWFSSATHGEAALLPGTVQWDTERGKNGLGVFQGKKFTFWQDFYDLLLDYIIGNALFLTLIITGIT